MRRFMTALLSTFLCMVLGGPSAMSSRPVVADLSNHLVAITTGFSGTDVLVFGATNEQPGNIVMVVRGPKETHIVRKKDRIAGVWVNRRQARFEKIPAYYAVASSAPLNDIVPPNVRKRHQIGLDSLSLKARDSRNHTMSEAAAKPFQDALIRLKQEAGLYPRDISNVSTLENRLFRAEFSLPATVPVGAYTVEVFFVHEGDVIGAEITPLFVSKTGNSAEIFDFATLHASKYALICIVFAVLAGWGIALAFRR